MKNFIIRYVSNRPVIITTERLPGDIQGYTDFYPGVRVIVLNELYSFMHARILLHELGHVCGFNETEAIEAEGLI